MSNSRSGVADVSSVGPRRTCDAGVRSNVPSVCLSTMAPDASARSTVTASLAGTSCRSRRQTAFGVSVIRRSTAVATPCRTTIRASGTSRVTSIARWTAVGAGRRHGEDGAFGGPGDPAQIGYRQPVLGEPHRLVRLQEGVGLLVAEQPGLQLDVRAVVVGQRSAPGHGLAIGAPGPDLVDRQFGRRGQMHCAAIACAGDTRRRTPRASRG